MTALNELSDRELATLMFDWRFWARTKQLPPPGGWRVWLILAGRGFGKTRTGAEWVRGLAERGRARRIALVAETAADARDGMIEGGGARKSGVVGKGVGVRGDRGSSRIMT